MIICDQSDAPHPTLGARTVDRDWEIRYVRTQTVGGSQARNAGIDTARLEILAFIDDDILVTPAWFGISLQVLVENGPRAVVRGQILPLDQGGPGRFAPGVRADPLAIVYQRRIKKDVLPSGAMALYRSAFDQVGGFDERLGAGTRFAAAEDKDLGFRLLEAGYRILYVPQAIVQHLA
jgi:GT2 family glycosyltransferase